MTTLKQQPKWRIKRDEEGEDCIKGKYGIIHQFPDRDLDVWVLSVKVSKAIERAGWTASQHYDDGALFIRPWEDLDQACKWIKAHRKRVVSQEQRLKMAARLAEWRKQKANAMPVAG